MNENIKAGDRVRLTYTENGCGMTITLTALLVLVAATRRKHDVRG